MAGKLLQLAMILLTLTGPPVSGMVLPSLAHLALSTDQEVQLIAASAFFTFLADHGNVKLIVALTAEHGTT